MALRCPRDEEKNFFASLIKPSRLSRQNVSKSSCHSSSMSISRRIVRSYFDPWVTPMPPPTQQGGLSMVNNPFQHLPPLTMGDMRMAAAGLAPEPPRKARLSTASTAVGTPGSEESEDSVTLVNAGTTGRDGVDPGCESVKTKNEPDNKPSKALGKESEDECDEEMDKTPGGSPTLNGMWISITAMLVQWLGKVGILLWGLVWVVGLLKEKKTPQQKGSKAGRKQKKIEDDACKSGTSHSKTPKATVYAVRPRLRARRPARQYLTVEGAKRRTYASPVWREEEVQVEVPNC
jgi:hypothetical protein